MRWFAFAGLITLVRFSTCPRACLSIGAKLLARISAASFAPIMTSGVPLATPPHSNCGHVFALCVVADNGLKYAAARLQRLPAHEPFRSYQVAAVSFWNA
jgi:hypothetical protein